MSSYLARRWPAYRIPVCVGVDLSQEPDLEGKDSSCQHCLPVCASISVGLVPSLSSKVSITEAPKDSKPTPTKSSITSVKSDSLINKDSSSTDAVCKDKCTTTYISTPTTSTSSPTCTSISPTAVDAPASVDPDTGLLFRSSCGITDATVAQCPYLCSRARGALFQECNDSDLSGEEPTGRFPPIEYMHCLPPCKATTAKSWISFTTSSILTANTPARADTCFMSSLRSRSLYRFPWAIYQIASQRECPVMNIIQRYCKLFQWLNYVPPRSRISHRFCWGLKVNQANVVKNRNTKVRSRIRTVVRF